MTGLPWPFQQWIKNIIEISMDKFFLNNCKWLKCDKFVKKSFKKFLYLLFIHFYSVLSLVELDLSSNLIYRSWQPKYSTDHIVEIQLFSATLILREISFGWFRRSETAISTISQAFNFDFCKYFTLENVKSSHKLKIQSWPNG